MQQLNLLGFGMQEPLFSGACILNNRFGAFLTRDLLSVDRSLLKCGFNLFHVLSKQESTLHLVLRLRGGAKKRKKKSYTTPKKNKHKRKKVKLAVLKYYKVRRNNS